MDSVTQFALGAVVGAVTLGPRIGSRKAILIGGLMGTVPDLDTFLPSDDPVQSFTSHRGATHSLIMQAIVTPLFAEPLVRLFQGLRDQRVRTYLAIYAIFATHALIDAITIYGTRLFWPIIEEPVGVGSMFIIDPLYTLPLLVAVIWGLCLRHWTPRIESVTRWALIGTTAYMALSVPLQQWAQSKTMALLAEKGIEAERVLTIAAPFTTLYWKTIVIDGPRYLNVYVPLLGGADDVTVYQHPRRMDLQTCLADDPNYKELTAFNDGFYKLGIEDGKAVVSDLRMGATPQYVFRFAVGEPTADGIKPLALPERRPVVRGAPGDIDWLLAGIKGTPITRPAEAETQVALSDLGPRGQQLAMVRCGADSG